MYKDGNRMMAWVDAIDEIKPIPEADKIEAYRVGGWWVVDKKDAYKIGDAVIYVSIDSWVPNSLAPFLSKGKNPKSYLGIKGERLRTVKLRGVISQGLLLPLEKTEDGIPFIKIASADQESFAYLKKGDDVTELLGIKKWEPPIPAELAGLVRGLFPNFIPKTAQERAQNITRNIFDDNHGQAYEVTLKLDGTSATFYKKDDYVGVCSRNLDLKVCEANFGNTYVRMLIDSGIQAFLEKHGNIAIQGEIMGPGIQGNPEGFEYNHFFVFDVYLIDEHRYMAPRERQQFVSELITELNVNFVKHIPIYWNNVRLSDIGIFDLEQLLEFAVGESIANPVREGVVLKRTDGRFSFKVISNKFLQDEK